MYRCEEENCTSMCSISQIKNIQKFYLSSPLQLNDCYLLRVQTRIIFRCDILRNSDNYFIPATEMCQKYGNCFKDVVFIYSCLKNYQN